MNTKRDYMKEYEKVRKEGENIIMFLVLRPCL